MYKVLSIDGGGIRGIIPAIILQAIEASTGKPVCELFDLIAGTSTGGILALGLATPDNDGTAKHPAKSLVDFYETMGPEIFTQRYPKLLGTTLNSVRAKYSTARLEKALDHLYAGARLKNVLCDVLIPSYDIELRDPRIFRRRKAILDPGSEDVRLTDVALATVAAPAYFRPHRLRLEEKWRTLIDGGVLANNPAMCAYVEAKAAHAGGDILLVSLGTGESYEPIVYPGNGGWGLARWAGLILGIVLDGTSQTIHEHLDILLPSTRYFRLQPELPRRRFALDDARPARIHELGLHAERLLSREDAKVKKLCSLLDG